VKKLVLRIRYGGLGDNLLWSPIPRLAKTLHGYNKVFISNYSEFRNPETKYLVWGRNPYIDGFVDEDAAYPSFRSIEEGKNILDVLVDFVGFPDDGVRFREPELYYKPVFQEHHSNLTLYDPNYVSKAGHPSIESIQQYFRDNGIVVDYQMKPLHSSLLLPNIPWLCVEGLERFCDVIHSCKAFYCLTSGSATLASAIGKSVTALHTRDTNPMFHHSKRNVYVRLG
jgi:hypothetical protein